MRLASGDALGRPVEFESADAIEETHGRLTEMIGNGTWKKPAGIIGRDARARNAYLHTYYEDIRDLYLENIYKIGL